MHPAEGLDVHQVKKGLGRLAVCQSVIRTSTWEERERDGVGGKSIRICRGGIVLCCTNDRRGEGRYEGESRAIRHNDPISGHRSNLRVHATLSLSANHMQIVMLPQNTPHITYVATS